MNFIENMKRYPRNWQEIALNIKVKANWQCQKCGKQCLRPDDDKTNLTKSERGKYTLTVHHCNYQPEDNREENLIAVCSGCHLSYHTRRKSNVLIGQLSFW